MAKNDSEYGAESIKILEGLEGVRRRPAMYIGSTSKQGLHHLVYEVVDNSVDEAMAGYCDMIVITLNKDGSVTVVDNGRGIPVEKHPVYKKPAVEIAVTRLHAGGKFDKGTYAVSGGLHGVGISVVSALSKHMKVVVKRDGKKHQQEYSIGKIKYDLKVTGKVSKDETGTEVTFMPDDTIFSITDFDFSVLASRFREVAFLNKGLKIALREEKTGKKEIFYYEGGLIEFVKWVNKSKEALHGKPVYYTKEENNVVVECAVQYNSGYQENVLGFVNTINTVEGGTHVVGFRTALTRAINDYGKKQGMLKDGNLTGDDTREGLTAIISVKVPEPQFEGQTKTKLGNSEIKGIVDSVSMTSMSEFFEENPVIARRIVAKCMDSQKARNAAKKAKDLVRRKNAFSVGGLPGKLADCSKKKSDDTELYIVEGDSAGGCFDGDTEIALVGGRNISFKQLVKEDSEGKQNFCYTIKEIGSVGIAKIENPRVTKKDARVIKVVLDNDEEIICTPDHKFMLRNGSYKQAKDLLKEDSLMPFQKLEVVETPKSLHATSSSQDSSRIQNLDDCQECKTSKAFLKLKRGVSLDSSKIKIFDCHQELKPDKKVLEIGSAQDLANPFGSGFAGPENSNLRILSEPEHAPDFSPRVLDKSNHKIKSIEFLDKKIDVYDLGVKDTHNFALSSGIFVHNSAKQGRNKEFQAILPLKGKILNVEKANLVKIFSSEQISNLITAIGTGIGEQFEAPKIRYSKIIIMCDADVDGSHIKTLLLTFFFRFMKELIEQGNIYVAVPPLYRLRKKKDHYVYTDDELESLKKRLGGGGSILRFKGLGEMNPEQLWETTMDPKKRMLKRVTIEDAALADEVFSKLMGDDVEARRKFIQERAKEAQIDV